MGYCHNCGHWCALRACWCAWCITFFYDNGRMPLKTDTPAPTTTLQAIYTEMGWNTHA